MLAGTGVRKISSVACGFSSIKIDYSDYLKSLISRINEVFVFSIKYCYSDILLKKTNKQKTEHNINLILAVCFAAITLVVSVTSASRYITSASCYITSASRYHLRYQSRCSMYIRGLIPRYFAELAEAVPIEVKGSL